MEEAYNAMQDVLKCELLFLLLCLLGVFCCVVTILSPRFRERKQKHAILGGVALLVLGVAFVSTSTIPLLKDYSAKNIVVEHCVYDNNVADRDSSSFRGRMGLTRVTLETTDKTVRLTTAPWRKDVFTKGKYNVVAYYFPNAKVLLHIVKI